MNYRKKAFVLILVIIILMIPEIILCQKDYHSGYVITNDNDTLFGLIKDRKSEPFGELYKKIRIRDRGIFPKKFGPAQIKGYYNGENEFESLWLDVTSRFFREDYFSIPGSGEKQFLKVISKGYLTYYHWEYVDPDSYYFDYIALFKREDETKLVRVTQGIFGLKKKIMAEYFRDCPELVIKILNKELKDPQEVADFYNFNNNQYE